MSSILTLLAGSFSSILFMSATACSVTSISFGYFTGAFYIFLHTSAFVFPLKGSFPKSQEYITMPRAHTSSFGVDSVFPPSN